MPRNSFWLPLWRLCVRSPPWTVTFVMAKMPSSSFSLREMSSYMQLLLVMMPRNTVMITVHHCITNTVETVFSLTKTKTTCFRDGRILAAAGRSRFIHLWALDTRKLLRIVEMPEKVTAIKQLVFLPENFDGGASQVCVTGQICCTPFFDFPGSLVYRASYLQAVGQWFESHTWYTIFLNLVTLAPSLVVVSNIILLCMCFC